MKTNVRMHLRVHTHGGREREREGEREKESYQKEEMTTVIELTNLTFWKHMT